MNDLDRYKRIDWKPDFVRWVECRRIIELKKLWKSLKLRELILEGAHCMHIYIHIYIYIYIYICNFACIYAYICIYLSYYYYRVYTVHNCFLPQWHAYCIMHGASSTLMHLPWCIYHDASTMMHGASTFIAHQWHNIFISHIISFNIVFLLCINMSFSLCLISSNRFL